MERRTFCGDRDVMLSDIQYFEADLCLYFYMVEIAIDLKKERWDGTTLIHLGGAYPSMKVRKLG